LACRAAINECQDRAVRNAHPVNRIRIQVNGRQLDDFLPPTGPNFEPGVHEFSVPLAKGKNTIVVTALNEAGWSKVQDGTLALTNERVGELDKRGTLYILAVGVAKYRPSRTGAATKTLATSISPARMPSPSPKRSSGNSGLSTTGPCAACW